jgi:hypothetical protein
MMNKQKHRNTSLIYAQNEKARKFLVSERKIYIPRFSNQSSQGQKFSQRNLLTVTELPKRFENPISTVLTTPNAKSLVLQTSLIQESRKNYTVEILTQNVIDSLPDRCKQEFSKYQSQDIHASFLVMQIDADSFNPK